MKNVTYRREYVKCGKGCAGCPHGPYWYQYSRESGRLRKKYVGKELPSDSSNTFGEGPRDRAQRRPLMTSTMAAQVLRIGPDADYAKAKTAFRRASLQTHPDRGGSASSFIRVTDAFNCLKRARGWN
jgi:hypothetical protein